MNHLEFENLPIGEIVADDFRTSSVFTDFGIDFCCGGKQSVQDACDELGIDVLILKGKVDEVKEAPLNQMLNFKDWEPGFLIDYIKNVHHTYVRKTLPELLFYTDKIANVHGEKHPELHKIASDVQKVSDELTQHLEQEEKVLFPAINSFLVNPADDTKSTIVSEITRMLSEHDFVGGVFDTINKTTGGYKTPEDACGTYQVAFKTMKQFEDDLHIHVHLENNILFPKALKL